MNIDPNDFDDFDSPDWRPIEICVFIAIVVVLIAIFGVFLEAAVAGPPVELHLCEHTTEAAMIRRVLKHDIPSLDEDLRVVRHYQDELRRIVVYRQSVDNFCQIGQHKARFPELAYEPVLGVLWLKREIDLWNLPQRKHDVEFDDETAKFAGLVTLGDEGKEVVMPQPWQEYELTAWKPPEVER